MHVPYSFNGELEANNVVETEPPFWQGVIETEGRHVTVWLAYNLSSRPHVCLQNLMYVSVELSTHVITRVFRGGYLT